jgi:DNA-binding transcriptional MerR regulator
VRVRKANRKQFPYFAFERTLLHTLSDITRITGGNRRTLQFWAEQGVLRSTRQHEGSGVPREFDDSEVVVACVVNALSSQGVPVGKLTAAADGIRRHLVPPIEREIFNDAIAGQGVNLLLLTSYFAKSDDVPKWTSLVSIFSDTRTNDTLEGTIRLLITDNFIAFACVNLNACLSGVQFRLAQQLPVDGLKSGLLGFGWPRSG